MIVRLSQEASGIYVVDGQRFRSEKRALDAACKKLWGVGAWEKPQPLGRPMPTAWQASILSSFAEKKAGAR